MQRTIQPNSYAVGYMVRVRQSGRARAGRETELLAQVYVSGWSFAAVICVCESSPYEFLISNSWFLIVGFGFRIADGGQPVADYRLLC